MPKSEINPWETKKCSLARRHFLSWRKFPHKHRSFWCIILRGEDGPCKFTGQVLHSRREDRQPIMTGPDKIACAHHPEGALCLKASSKWAAMFRSKTDDSDSRCPRCSLYRRGQDQSDAKHTGNVAPDARKTCSAWLCTSYPSPFPTPDSHPKRHISTLIISLPGGYSPTSVSSTQCQLNADPWNVRQALWISLCPSVHLSRRSAARDPFVPKPRRRPWYMATQTTDELYSNLQECAWIGLYKSSNMSPFLINDWRAREDLCASKVVQHEF